MTPDSPTAVSQLELGGGDSTPGTAHIDRYASPTAKIALFRPLFRGREDIYPQRFESRKTGKSGYQPACANEWVEGVCHKPRIKCSDCLNQRFLPVTDTVIQWHLSGQNDRGQPFVMGVYPMLRDESCYFLAADFDGANWMDDANAFLATCSRLDVPASLERSRSGEGGHVWLFFQEAIPAKLARELAAHILTETMEQRPGMGLHSYDRFFPNQDTLPKGGFGNLIALPLQKKARQHGNSLFIDKEGAPYADQWAYLAAVQRISRQQIEELVNDAKDRDRIVGVRVASTEADSAAPWSRTPSRQQKDPPLSEPLPEHLDIVLGDQVYIRKDALPPALRNRLHRLAAFQNPEFYRAQARRLPTYDKPRIIDCAEVCPEHLALPRGCLEDVRKLLKAHKIKPVLHDKRCEGTPLTLSFSGELRPEQAAAAEALSTHETGVLAATTAFGKTVIAAWLIAHRQVNTLILVHRRQLLQQWIDRLSAFLEIPPTEIGRFGGGKKRLTGNLDIALIQSLSHKGEVDDRIANYGHVIVDECHHISARSFELVARRAKARYITGLSATTIRQDGHHPIIFMQCGPARYRVDAKAEATRRPFSHRVFVRPTQFRPAEPLEDDQRIEFHKVSQALVEDETRNRLIAGDVEHAVSEGRCPLLLTERTEHVDRLKHALSAKIDHVLTLRGGMSHKTVQATTQKLNELPDDSRCVVIATGRFIGEGFDHPRFDTLFLALPVSWRGTIAQYVGRLHRHHDRKKEVRVYDYVDLQVPMLARMFDRRCRGYEAVGYTLMLPASALPGWPQEVPLSADPDWKKDYAASVRRLVQDGVDPPLASLFAHATGPTVSDNIDNKDARSATEAFLYRRLQTLPETAERFRLNVTLPIPFDGQGLMEVDLFCADAGLVIELDGSAHFADLDAYRRDRRKDFLLQQHGYLVLRFLAEDLGTHLNDVLDTILSALTSRSKPHRTGNA